jgi:hypothetical protein
MCFPSPNKTAMANRCVAQKTDPDRTPCERDGQAAGHLCLCRLHLVRYDRYVDQAGPHHPGQCFHFIRENGIQQAHWCDRFVPPGTYYCDRHRHDPVPRHLPLPDPLRAGARPLPPGLLREPPPLPPPRAGSPDPRFPEPPQVARGLRALAADNQNVHTREVNQQTEDGIRRLCAVAVSPAQDTRKTLVGVWCTNIPTGWEKIYTVYRDIEKWFTTQHCRTVHPQEPDNLYYKTIRGLVAYILKVENLELRNELFKRAYEECKESVGLCCDGHLARLVNVLVGFDDAFKPPVSQGDLIQDRMSAINAMSVPTDEKVRLANAYFTELGVGVDDRAAWIVALADS